MTVHEPTEADYLAADFVSSLIALCDDPACDPANYKICTKCEGLVNASFPDRCTETDCPTCHPRGAAEAARAEQ